MPVNQIKENLKKEVDSLKKQVDENDKLLKTASGEMVDLINEENIRIKQQIKDLGNSIKQTVVPNRKTGRKEDRDIDSNRAILEIRAGTGGDEAGLFALDLYRMYQRYAEKKGWRMHELSKSSAEHKSIKTVTSEIKGDNAYNILQYESGVHRVQRIPVTESSGRIHTSTATVAILPVVSPIHVEINPKDIKTDFYRAGGSGGQNVNKVSTAVRITHIPTKIIVECQEERTQGRNREKALDILRSRLYKVMQEKRVKDISKLRSGQVGAGERSEKIRTYNFPQDRVTDHRIGKSWHNLEEVLDGEIDEILESLAVKT